MPGERLAVDLEGAQVAGVDADDPGAGVERADRLLLVVHLDQRGHAEALDPLQQADQGVLLERRDDQQHEVGAVRAGLPHLVRRDDEVLAQHRDRRPRARTASRSASDPPKRRCSVSTVIIAAPPASYSVASAAGSAIVASWPVLGLDRLTSAITATPGPAAPQSASRGAGAWRELLDRVERKDLLALGEVLADARDDVVEDGHSVRVREPGDVAR